MAKKKAHVHSWTPKEGSGRYYDCSCGLTGMRRFEGKDKGQITPLHPNTVNRWEHSQATQAAREQDDLKFQKRQARRIHASPEDDL